MNESELKRFIPAGLRRRLRPAASAYIGWRRRRPYDLGDLRRTTPLDPNWGFGRGTPVDRVYIEEFLAAHRADIKGRVLEIASPRLANKFGSAVDKVDVLMVGEGNPEATIVGDLADAPHIADNSFDCAIITQTLHLIYDLPAAMRTLHRILAPGGVLLVTAPGITKLAGGHDDPWGDCWHFTARSMRWLAEEMFEAQNVEVQTIGNVLSVTAFLYGLAGEDLKPAELAVSDPLYPVTISLRSVKT